VKVVSSENGVFFVWLIVILSCPFRARKRFRNWAGRIASCSIKLGFQPVYKVLMLYII